MTADRRVTVLLGGGVESTWLVRSYLNEQMNVLPVHVHCGLRWDDAESRSIRRFLASCAGPNLADLLEIRLSLREFLGGHWAAGTGPAPAAGSDGSLLELPVRNLTLLALTLSKVKSLGQSQLALGTTADNHYPDGSREYFDRCERVLSLEAGRDIKILTPLIQCDKAAVLRRSDRETLALSFSCVDPQGGRHCGRCIKCGRRKAAFAQAGLADPTDYAESA